MFKILIIAHRCLFSKSSIGGAAGGQGSGPVRNFLHFFALLDSQKTKNHISAPYFPGLLAAVVWKSAFTGVSSNALPACCNCEHTACFYRQICLRIAISLNKGFGLKNKNWFALGFKAVFGQSLFNEKFLYWVITYFGQRIQKSIPIQTPLLIL